MQADTVFSFETSMWQRRFFHNCIIQGNVRMYVWKIIGDEFRGVFIIIFGWGVGCVKFSCIWNGECVGGGVLCAFWRFFFVAAIISILWFWLHYFTLSSLYVKNHMYVVICRELHTELRCCQRKMSSVIIIWSKNPRFMWYCAKTLDLSTNTNLALISVFIWI